MHKKSYRILLAPAALILSICFSFSCKKSDPVSHPTIRLVCDSGLSCRDTSLVIGGRINLAVHAEGEGSNITFLQVNFNDGTRKILLDSGLNHPTLDYRLLVIKSASAYERWTFLVMDRQRNLDSVSLLVTRADSSQYGPIRTLPDLLIGAQENEYYGSFLSFTAGTPWFLDSACVNQALTDLVYYFGQYDGTLSSAAEAEAPSVFTGPCGIAAWTVKNETRYDTTMLTTTDFDNAANDSLLLAVYEPTAGKRKAKFIVPGMVVSFRDAAGRIGLLKVSETVPGTTGRIRISVKIQD